MARRYTFYLSICVVLMALTAAAVYADAVDRVRKSIEILGELTGAEDNAIPEYILERAEAVIVIPSFMKGGFIVGAEHGKGIMSVRDRASNSWSPPTFVAMTGGSFGAQIGLQSVDLVLLVMNRGGVEQVLKDKFTLGGDVSVAAGPIGRSAKAATDYHFDSQILAYSRAKGLFAGATLSGTTLQSDHSAIEDLYGRRMSSREIVLENRVKAGEVPALVTEWRNALARHTGSSEAVPTTGR